MSDKIIKLSAIALSSALCGWLMTSQATAAAPPEPVAGKVVLGVTVAEAELIATGWRLSKLLKAEVRNDKAEKIGRIDDVLVSSDGKLSTAIIDVGGFLGIGAHKVAIPVHQLVLAADPTKIMLPGASKEALKSVPEFRYAS